MVEKLHTIIGKYELSFKWNLDYVFTHTHTKLFYMNVNQYITYLKELYVLTLFFGQNKRSPSHRTYALTEFTEKADVVRRRGFGGVGSGRIFREGKVGATAHQLIPVRHQQ